jgi:dTDP-4-amino-4,6-dideoxygalactose transaminase
LRAENRLLREDLRIREESQIPVIPKASQERIDYLVDKLEKARAAIRAAWPVWVDIAWENKQQGEELEEARRLMNEVLCWHGCDPILSEEEMEKVWADIDDFVYLEKL